MSTLSVPRFTRVTLSNYRSLGENVSIELGPLTVLVGTNGSGKSNVADAFRFLARALDDGLENAIEERHGFEAVRRDVGGRRGDLRMRFEVSQPGDWAGEYELVLGGTRDRYRIKHEQATISHNAYSDRYADTYGATERFLSRNGVVIDAPKGLERPAPDASDLTFRKIGGDERLAPLFKALQASEVYAIFPDTLREPQKPSQRPYLTKFGDNWSSILRKMTGEPGGDDLRAGLVRVTGDIVELRVRRAGGGYLIVEFGHARAEDPTRRRWFDAARESDGTLRVAGLLTALLQQPPLTLIGIEEPELTIHPGMIPLIYDFVGQATAYSQVLLTTHSPDLLDLLDIDDVWVVQRYDGTTTVGRIDESQRRLVRERLARPGDLFRSEGFVLQDDPSLNA